MKQNIIYSASFIIGMVLLGLCIKGGIDNFANKDRQVTVKGLAEQEVPADKVTWPISTKEIGDDLPALYAKINQTNQIIRQFLKAGGIKDDEITTVAPTVIDLNAERYNENRRPYRYNITSTITVSSNQVDRVRQLMARQGELLQKGIAIVEGDYDAPKVKYELVSFPSMKGKMMTEAIKNAEATAQQFAENSHSTLNKITRADQGQFSIDDRDDNTPHIKKVRVVTTVTYSLKD